MKRWFGLVLMGLLGCGSSHHMTAAKAPAPPPAPVVAHTTPPSQADQVITQARQHYFVGERELSLGHLEKAKEEFNASLDVLMEYQDKHDPDPKIQAVVDELQGKIYDQEMAALNEGDGFTEHPLEPALIDDLKNIDTFPAPDQQTKNEVEQDLKTTQYDIPMEVNDQVLSYIRLFQNSRRNELAGGLVRSGRYVDTMKKIFREEGVPEDLVYTALIESSFKPNAYSRARAKGFWQFISGTAKRYGLQMNWWIDERSDFEKSTRAAARYLNDLHDMFNDWYLALAAYNTGENNITSGLSRTGADNFWDLAQTRHMMKETKKYVPAILAGIIIAKDPQKYGFTEQPDAPLVFETVEIDYPVDLRLVAECTGASLEEVRMLNSGLNRLTTPANGSYDLKLPKDSKDVFQTEIASIPEDKRITWRKHEVKEGDSLTSIAALYHTSVSSIASVNSFDPDNTLSLGQKIIIPMARENSISIYPTKETYTRMVGEKRYYSVRKGDTLSSISNQYRVSVDQLRAWNHLGSHHTLHVGDSLVVSFEPEYASSSSSTQTTGKKVVYRVKRGDTLTQIANNYNTDVQSIIRWNHLTEGSIINPGDRITIYRK
jgi:peptidoglycan lytic transglycosylase D